MDGTRFDNLIKRLATRPMTRATALRGLAASAAALTGVSILAGSGEAANNNNNNNDRKRKVCKCTSATATSCRTVKKEKKKAKRVLRRFPCSYKGKCRAGVTACAAPVGCSPANNTQGTCAPGQLCNTSAVCVAGCTGGPGQGSCPSGQQCRNGQCQGQNLGCTQTNNTPNTQGSCPAGQVCNANFICVAGCTGQNNTQGTCPAQQVCVNGQCQGQTPAGGCTPTNNTQGNCPPNQVCNTFGVCVPAVGCLNVANTNDQCGASQFCCPSETASAGECRGNLQAC